MVQQAERGADGYFECFHHGSNTNPAKFATLDEVAEFLRRNPGAGVRMNPRWSKISRFVFIDGVLL